MFKTCLNYFRIKYQSLIFKILLYFTLSAMAVAIILSWNFASRIKPRFENEVLPNLAQYIEYLVADVGTPPDLIKARNLSQRLPFELRIEGPDIDWSSSAFILPLNRYRFRSAPYPYNDYQITRQRRHHLLLTEKNDYRFLFLLDSSFNTGSRHRHWTLFILLAGILLILYLGIRTLFKPLIGISEHLKKIGAGNLDDPIEVKGASELSQLADGINQMTVDIKTMLESKAGLLLAISHELRSPITRMRINLELLEQTDRRESLISDLQEMEQLVTGILESERLNTRHASLNRSQFNLAETIETLVSQNFEDCDIETRLEPVQVNFDEMRVQLLLKNLIDNACRYSRESGEAVEVRLSTQDQQVILNIIDHGPGLNSEELKHITEPFYRADSARLRKTGGYGLGLYLCKLIVEAHQGRLAFESAPGKGMQVKVYLPLE